MEQRTLAKWLKLTLTGVGLCGLIVYLVVIPACGQSAAAANPEYQYCYWPWLIFLWSTGIPCFTALAFGWRIASNIGLERSFVSENARLLKWIAWLAAGDSLLFLVGNLTFLALGMSHPGVALLSLLGVFAGGAVVVAAASLSHLVLRAAALQTQSDLTI